MFWGISLQAGKRYSQTVEKSFHISMAALNASNGVKDSVTVMVEVEKACYPLCTLHPDRIPQQALDYFFTEGEEVLFYTEGNLNVHLTGYLIDDPNPVECSSDEEVESADESNAQSSNEEKQTPGKNKPKKESSDSGDNVQSLISELDNLNEDNAEGSIDLWLPRSARKRLRQSGELAEGQVSLTEKLLKASSEESSDEDNDWQPGPKRKPLKKNGKYNVEDNTRKGKKLTDNSNHTDNKNNITHDIVDSPRKQMLSPSKSKKKSLKEKDVKASDGLTEQIGCGDDIDEKNCSQQSLGREDKNKMDSENTAEKPHNRKDLSGETVIEDLVKGQGKKAKKGKQVSLYYKGMLKKTKEEFDSCQPDGEPFIFKLGDGKVIKGLEVGVEGMQVGGKRKLTIPPSQGYDSMGTGPNIPPNSTLVFVVELVKMH